ncbi:MAG: HAD family hydrolase [Acidimicrobiales bacterium]
MSGELELVIFDCDGVLVDSERLAIEVEIGVLADLGWVADREEIIDRFLGVSDEDYVALIESHLGITLPPSFLPDMAPRYRAAFDRELGAVPGIVDALDTLEQADVGICVASSGAPDKMRHTLGLTGLWSRFEGRVFSVQEVARGKPAPDLFCHAAASLGVAPASCAVVEDSPVGVRAGIAAGMRTIAYAGGLVPLERLSLPGVTVISDMRELAPRLLGDHTSAARP